MSKWGWIWLGAYIGTIFAANFSIGHLGDCSRLPAPCTIPVWWGLAAPSGVLWVGIAFTLRDMVQETAGRRGVLAAIGVGALLSALLSPKLALASGVAFLLSEGADMLVYTPLRARSWVGAVVASNIVGDTIDSVLFLALAFGSLDFLAGQLIGKWEMTLIVLPLVWLARRQMARRNMVGA